MDAADPWDALEDARWLQQRPQACHHQQQQHVQQQQQHQQHQHQQQHGQQPGAALRVPTFARRGQPAQQQGEADRVEETDEVGGWVGRGRGKYLEHGIGAMTALRLQFWQPAPSAPSIIFNLHGPACERLQEEEWDEGMLAEVAALEQQAMAQHAQLAQQQAQRRVPVFRSRVHTQAAGSAGTDAIEDASSNEEQPAMTGPAATAGGLGVVGGPRRPGAVPQLGGRRAALPLAAAAAAAAADAGADELDGRQAPSAAVQQTRPALRQPAGRQAFAVPAPPETQLLCIDFTAVDVESLRPSVLLGYEGLERAADGCAPWQLLQKLFGATLSLPVTTSPSRTNVNTRRHAAPDAWAPSHAV